MFFGDGAVPTARRPLRWGYRIHKKYLQEMLRILDQEGQKLGLKINMAKTKMMTVEVEDPKAEKN